MTKFRPDQVDEMAELRERGWSYARLAARYDVSPGAIHYRCLCVGALSPQSQPIVDANRRSNAGHGFGRSIKHFTVAEDLRLLDMARSGHSIREIMAELGRAKTSVRMRLLTLELKAELA